MISGVILIPFTPLQKLLRQWEHVSPHNGAQAMLVDGVLDPDLVESAWQSTLRDMGLGRVHVEEDEGYSHEIWSGDPPTPLVSHVTSDQDVCSYLQEQVNRRFLPAPAMPYRAFALQHEDRCYLGIVYQQWIADSVSIRLLMREWFYRIFFPARARKKLIDLPRLRQIRGPELRPIPRELVGAAKQIYRWTRDRKHLATLPSCDEPGQTSLRRYTFAAGELDDIMLVARAEGCTINDLLIGMLASAITPHLRKNELSTHLAIASSIDLRPYAQGDLSETFGSLLTYVPVTCPLEANNRLDLAQEAARQTRRIKDPERIARYLVLPRLIGWKAARLHHTDGMKYFRKAAPICATVANVNLNRSWLALYHSDPVREYIRVASASPAMPVAVTATTLGNRFELVVSAQSPGLPETQASELADDFASGLRSLVQSRS